MKKTRLAALTLAALALPSHADPCGMVPPIWLGDGQPITRVGIQRTYAFWEDGLETLVLRPGFEGRVDEFGMLIPFPSPPEIRKVADDVFAHVAAAVDPPEVVVDLRQRYFACDMPAAGAMRSLGYVEEAEARKEQVVVLRREAVGMYEVAVLDAGSAAALQVWMDDHGFRYPQGMDDVCQEYVDADWCFVAVKARVGSQGASQPRPGMRDVDVGLPEGASFDGHVQAMGFRFRSDRLVVPMRLSAFNPGELRNIVYVLSDVPRRISGLPEEFVVRQIPGSRILSNLTEPLPLRILGGELEDVPDWRRQNLESERDPIPHNGIARELFASDLLAARTGELSHAYEKLEKDLLDIGEQLGLRGSDLDALHHDALAKERERMVLQGLGRLADMTLTVIDSDFPREVIAADNLHFTAFAMPSERNDRELYDARAAGPPPALGGTLGGPFVGAGDPRLAIAGALLFVTALVVLVRRRALARVAAAGAVVIVALGSMGMSPVDALREDEPAVIRCGVALGGCIPVPVEVEAKQLVSLVEPSDALVERGRAIVRLARIGGEAGLVPLARLARQAEDALVRTWAAAALMQQVESSETLLAMSDLVNADPALERPFRIAWTTRFPDEPEALLATASRVPALTNAIAAGLRTTPTDVLVSLALTSEDDGARRLAAGFLATRAGQGDVEVAGEFVRALRFSVAADEVPWKDGALFVPSLGWSREDSRALWRELISWHLFSEQRGAADDTRKVYNALNSWGLANAAGYPMPNRELSSTRWFLTYGETVGVESLRVLLDRHDLKGDRRFRALLVLLGGEG